MKKIIGIMIIALFIGASIPVTPNMFIKPGKANINFATNMIGYWSFNWEPYQNIVYDDSGNARNGVNHGAIWYSSGGPDNSSYFEFDGNDYIDIPNTNGLGFHNQDFSFSCWVQIYDNSNNDRCIWSLGDPIYSNSNFVYLKKCRSGGVFTGLQGGLKIPDSYGYTSDSNLTGDEIPKNVWIHIVIVYDYSNHKLKMYYNGILNDFGDLRDFNLLSVTQLDMNIGRLICPYAYNYHVGKIDEVRIYNKALNDFEIQRLYKYSGNQPPIADFTWSPLNPSVGSITFNASESYDPDGYILQYEWDFDNDGIYEKLDEIPSFEHFFSSAGEYNVTLKVTDDVGANNTIMYSVNIGVSNDKPYRPFYVDGPIKLKVGQYGKFTTESSDPNNDDLQYRFNWSSSGTPDISDWSYFKTLTNYSYTKEHTWWKEGTYNVTAQARDIHRATSDWSESSEPLTVIVYPPNKPPIVDVSRTTITPNPGAIAHFVHFEGYGNDPDPGDIIIDYSWKSNISGNLSNQSEFYISILPIGNHLITFKVKDDYGAWSNSTDIALTIKENSPPSSPQIYGLGSGYVGIPTEIIAESIDPDNDNIRYGWDWDSNRKVDDWTGFYKNGDKCYMNHTWSKTGRYDVSVMAEDSFGAQSGFSNPMGVVIDISRPPNKPIFVNDGIHVNPTIGTVGNEYRFYVNAIDPDGDTVQYIFDWGDGSLEAYSNWWPSGSGYVVGLPHIWKDPGIYEVRVQARDSYWKTSLWSNPWTITIGGIGKPKAFIDEIKPRYFGDPATISLKGHGVAQQGTYLTKYRWTQIYPKTSTPKILKEGTYTTDWVEIPSSVFSSPGSYVIGYSVIDNLGFGSDIVLSEQLLFLNFNGRNFGPLTDPFLNPYSINCSVYMKITYPWGSSGCSSYAATSRFSGNLNVEAETKPPWDACNDAMMGMYYNISNSTGPGWYQINTEYKSIGGRTTKDYGGASSSLTIAMGKKNWGSSSYDDVLLCKTINIDPFWTWDEARDNILNLIVLLGFPTSYARCVVGVMQSCYHTDKIMLLRAMLEKDYQTTYMSSDPIFLTPGRYLIGVDVSARAYSNIVGEAQMIRWGYIPYVAINYLGGKASENDMLFKTNSIYNLQIITDSKIDVTILDPNGKLINKSYSDIPRAIYSEIDFDDDNSPEDFITIPNPINGNYYITVHPQPDASPNDKYSIKYSTDGSNFEYLAENIPIPDFPSTPYQIKITSNNPPLVMLSYPTSYNTLNNTIVVKWYAYDNEEGNNLPISIYYSDDEGKNWYAITKKPVENNGIYYLDTILLPDGIYSFKAETVDNDGNIGYDISEQNLIENHQSISYDNQPPVKPTTPRGKVRGKIGVEYTYFSNTSDVELDSIYYLFDWGDGTTSLHGPIISGEGCEASHSWNEKGDYEIRVKAKDEFGLESEWSDPLIVSMPKNKKIHQYRSIIKKLLDNSYLLKRLSDISINKNISGEQKNDFLISPNNGKIYGNIKTINGSNVPNSTVLLWEGLTLAFFGMPNDFTNTDSNGYYEFENLSYGRYHINPAKKGFRVGEKNVFLNEKNPERKVDFTAVKSELYQQSLIFLFLLLLFIITK